MAYGRTGGRRRGSAAWQWIVIGLTLGFGCAVVFVLLLLTLGTLQIDTGEEDQVVDTQATIEAAQVGLLDPAAVQATVNAAQAGSLDPAAVQATVDAALADGVAAALAATQTARPTLASVVAFPTSTPTTDPNLPQLATQPASGSAVTNTQPAASTPAPVQTEFVAPALPTSDGALAAASPTPMDPRLDRLVALASPLLSVSGGSFTMGTTFEEINAAVNECVNRDGGNCLPAYGEDSFPPHTVTVDDFWIEETEVTNEQFVAFLDYLGPNSHRNGCGGFSCVETTAENEFSLITFDSQNYDVPDLQARFPVVGVTWYGANAYCQALGRRLPTEAEWERAARGENAFIYPWGDTWVMDFARTSRPERVNTPLEVGSIPANASQYGALDMAGNVAEWVFDWYGATWYQQQSQTGALNPSGPVSGSDRVVRGGSWDTVPFFARAVHRQHFRPDNAYLWLGFRCASDTGPQAATVDVAVPTTDSSALNPAELGPVATDSGSEALPTQPVDARPGLPTLAVPNVTATSVPAVPPGG